MRRALSLAVAGVIAVSLGIFGSAALASTLTGSAAEAADSVKDSERQPSVYGTR